MPQIGTFTQHADGFVGRIHTFAHCREIGILPAEPSDAENAPDFRIHLRHDDSIEVGPEIGAGWKRTGERAGTFIALIIDDPALPQRLGQPGAEAAGPLDRPGPLRPGRGPGQQPLRLGN